MISTFSNVAQGQEADDQKYPADPASANGAYISSQDKDQGNHGGNTDDRNNLGYVEGEHAKASHQKEEECGAAEEDQNQ